MEPIKDQKDLRDPKGPDGPDGPSGHSGPSGRSGHSGRGIRAGDAVDLPGALGSVDRADLGLLNGVAFSGLQDYAGSHDGLRAGAAEANGVFSGSERKLLRRGADLRGCEWQAVPACGFVGHQEEVLALGDCAGPSEFCAIDFDIRVD